MLAKKWINGFIFGSFFSIFLIFGIVFIVDPFIHYRLPDARFSYILNRESQRYVNNGISRLFDYDAIITGTSMTECFKNSEFDNLFGTKSIKVPYAGARYDEITDNLNAAYKSHNDIKYIVRSLDYYALIDTPTHDRTNDDSYPMYLFDSDVFNDYKYVLGKKAFAYSLVGIIKSIVFTEEKKTISFDNYCNWSDKCIYGKSVLLNKRIKFGKPSETKKISSSEQSLIEANIKTNLINIANEHPNTMFYYFLPPFSIVKWGELYESGEIEKTVQVQKYAVEMLLGVHNIKVFAYDDCQWITTNLDNYREKEHFGGWINSYILDTMFKGEHEITHSNIDNYFEGVKNFYLCYNYNSMF